MGHRRFMSIADKCMDFFLQIVQTGFGVYPTFFSVGTGNSSQGAPIWSLASMQ
jgi:hypothetical protein